MSNIEFTIPYFSRTDGQLYNLSVIADLEEPVSNSITTESTSSIQNNAPLIYSTQNRMVSAADYSVLPLQSSTDIKKLKVQTEYIVVTQGMLTLMILQELTRT